MLREIVTSLKELFSLRRLAANTCHEQAALLNQRISNLITTVGRGPFQAN